MRLHVPTVGAEEIAEVASVIESGYLTQGSVTAALEESIRSVVGTGFAFATSSATTGLHLSLRALGVQAGDEVIVPAFTFPATANAVLQQGAEPVFVDIDETTFAMDAGRLNAAVSPRTVAIMPVHAFGLCADMDPINAIASRHGVPVLEDAACALTAEYHGRQAGTLGALGVFSFHPRKIITTGEGGMVVTDDEVLAERLQILRSHGGVRGELFLEFVDAGYNYRLSDVHAAIGMAQMQKLAVIADERIALAGRLSERLSDHEAVRTPSAPPGRRHSFQSYVVDLDEEVERDQVIREMRARDVETTLGTYGLHLQPFFRDRAGLAPDHFPAATRAHRQTLTLPLYPGMTDSDLDRVADALRESVAASRRARQGTSAGTRTGDRA